MDLDDDLLALVGDEPAQSTSQAPAESDSEDAGNKRKRARDDSGSDMEESDSSDDEGNAGPSQSDDFVSPFPYQTLFHDKADKAHIMGLNEVERESILAERQDEVQKQNDRIQVRKMATQLAGGRPPADGGSAAPASSDGPLGALHVRGKSDRKKTQTGKNEKKSSTLDELKRKRESKKRREAGEEYDEGDFGGSSSKPSVRRQSPTFSDDDEDDASVQDDGGAAAAAPSSSRLGKKKFSDEESVDELGLRALFLQRNHCLQHWNKPWFGRAATGAYVRIVVGPDPQDPKENVYRLCSVSGIVEPFSAGELQAREKAAEEAAREAAQDANSDMEASDSDDEANGVRKNAKQNAGGGKANSVSQKKLQSIQADLATEKKRRAFQPYKLPDGGDLCDVMLDVRHGKAAKQVPITALSNQPFSRREYQRLVATCLNDNVGMPLKTDAEPKAREIKECLASMRSEADIDHALRKKKMLHDPKHVVFIKTMCRDATSSESQRQRLESEIQSITARLPGAAYLSSSTAPGTPGSPAKQAESPGKRPPLGAEGSRGSSHSLVQLSERNRRANREEVRRAEQAANEARRKAEGTGRVDPSARVRTSVKVLHDVRASTPDPNQTVVFEAPTNAQDESSAKMKAVVAEAQNRNKVGPTKLEESAKDIALDLGDF